MVVEGADPYRGTADLYRLIEESSLLSFLRKKAVKNSACPRVVEGCTVQYDCIQVVQDDCIQFCDIIKARK